MMQVLYSMCFSSLWGAVIDIDQQLFLFLNGLHGTWLDPVMKFITGIPQWIPLYLLIIFFLFRKRDWRVGLLALLGVLLTFGITDQVGNLIKSAVQRPRPCLEFEGLIHILTGCGGKYASFISNHAANTFGLAMFTSLFFKKRSYSVFIFTWAAVVSYSRIYVGKHYPLDILAGALVGMLAGYLVYRLFAFIIRRSRFKMQDARCKMQDATISSPPTSYFSALFSIAYYVYFILVTPALFVAAGAVTLLTCLFDRNRKALHYYSYFWGLQYYWVAPWWRIRVEGLEHVAPHKKYVIMSNHQSMLDICLLYKVPKRFKWISKKEVERIPLLGWTLWLHRDIIITRGDRAGLKKMLGESQKYLNGGVSVIMFPEGTRTKDGQLHEFKEGGFLMARTAKAAILPVVINGNFDVLSGWKLNRKQVFRVKILPEIPESEVAATPTKETMAKVHASMLQAHKAMAPEKYVE